VRVIKKVDTTSIQSAEIRLNNKCTSVQEWTTLKMIKYENMIGNINIK